MLCGHGRSPEAPGQPCDPFCLSRGSISPHVQAPHPQTPATAVTRGEQRNPRCQVPGATVLSANTPVPSPRAQWAEGPSTRASQADRRKVWVKQQLLREAPGSTGSHSGRLEITILGQDHSEGHGPLPFYLAGK